MNKNKPVILVTNDDGITANGLHALVRAMRELGEVVVVAPESPQSGMGHAITISHPLRLEKADFHSETTYYRTSGTPVDCVKLAVNQVLKKKPDLVVSGINHGPNSSVNIFYSGTLSAAMEGAIMGIPSIGFSLQNFSENADMNNASYYAGLITENYLQDIENAPRLLNVNIPDPKDGNIKGIKICRQATARYEEEFEKRTDPRGVDYFWLTGKLVNHDQKEDTDEYALKEGYVSVVPVKYDLTNYNGLEFLKSSLFKEELH